MLKCDFQYQQADFGLNIKLEMSQQLVRDRRCIWKWKKYFTQKYCRAIKT
jgi:hypothetical protein